MLDTSSSMLSRRGRQKPRQTPRKIQAPTGCYSQVNPILKDMSNCNCNWGTCIAPCTWRPRAHHRVNPYLGAPRQNETEMFSDHDETSPSIAAFSAPSVERYLC